MGKDLGLEIKKTAWTNLHVNSQKRSSDIAIRENVFEIIYRCYLVPVKLKKMDPEISNPCWWCNNFHANLLHIWGVFTDSQLFGGKFTYWMKIFDRSINFSSEILLLSLFDDSVANKNITLMSYMGYEARVLIAKHQKSVKVPGCNDWLHILYYIMLMCKLSACNKFYQGHLTAFRTFLST